MTSIEKSVGVGLSIFPLARGLTRTILYGRADQEGKDLMWIENLRGVEVKPLPAGLIPVILARSAPSQRQNAERPISWLATDNAYGAPAPEATCNEVAQAGAANISWKKRSRHGLDCVPTCRK